MKKFLLFVFFVALLYAIFLWSIVIEIREFRKLPQQSIAEKYFTGKYPHDIFARALIFKRGAPSYECTIRSWAYKPNQISNTLWNRWILENDVSRMTLKERVEHLPDYPLDPEGILPYLKDILYGFSDGYKVLSILAKFQASTNIYQDWIEKKIVLRQDSKLFLKCIKYIVELPDVDMGKLFEIFLSDLIVATEKDLSDAELGWFQYYQLKSCGSDLYSFYIISQFLKIGTKTSASLLDWMDKSLSNNKLELTAFVARVIGLYTYSTNLQEVQVAQTILMRELGELDPCEASFLDCSTIPAKKLFSITQLSSPLVAISFFHNLAHGSIIEAEAVAKPILSGPDSELRKGLIVLLIRHGSSVGKLYLDDAFRGNAKRSILFQHIEQYVYGSEVVERYCRIARHAYTGIPKTWPLYGFDGSTWQEEVGEWQKFIDEIPWFPGTDDAYYRMGYLQYAFGNWEDAVKTIREFASKELPDNDARQYVAHLLRNLSFKEELLHERFPELEHVYHIQRLGILVFEQHPDIQNNINSINWLLSNVNYQRLLDIDEKVLNKMTQIANDIGKNSSVKPLEILLRSHNDIFDFDNFSKIFYGLSNPPEYPENLKSQRESLDSNYRLIKNIALRLKDESENMSFQNEKRARILWALIHFYLMPYNYRDDFAFAIDLAKSLDRQDFPTNLDWMYKRLHGGY